MSLKDYKLIDKAKSHYVLQHADGTKFVVAHDGLDDSMHKKIQFLNAGGVAGMPEESPVDSNNIDIQPGTQIPEVDISQLPKEPAQAAQAPEEQPIMDDQIGTFGAQQTQQPQSPADLTSGLQLQKDALQAQGDVEKSYFKKQEAMLGEQSKQNQEFIKKYEQQQSQFQAERAIAEQDLRESKVDPNRYYSNMDTGQKIMATLGILLGGGGGQENAAIQYFNKMIDRDIAAQEKNMDKKKNMLSMLYEKHKDMNLATLQLRDMQLSDAKVKLEKLTANMNSQNAKLVRAQGIGLIEQQQNQIQQQYAAAMAAAGSVSNGLTPQSSNMRAATDEKYAAKRVKVGDRYFEAASPEEAKEIRQVQEKAAPLKDMIKRLDSVGPAAAVPGTEANMKAQALMSSAVLNMKEMFKLGVLSESDVKIVEGMLNDPKKFRNLINGDAKSREVFTNIDNALESEYKNKLSGYKGSVKGQTKPGFSK